MLLLCSFFGLNELFQVKKDLTMSLLFFFLKMAKIWVGEKKRGWPKLKKGPTKCEQNNFLNF